MPKISVFCRHFGFISAIMHVKLCVLHLKNNFYHVRTHFNPQTCVYFLYTMDYKAFNLMHEFLSFTVFSVPNPLLANMSNYHFSYAIFWS